MPALEVSRDIVVTAWLEAEAASPRFSSLLTKHSNNEVMHNIISGTDQEARIQLLKTARPSFVGSFPWDSVQWFEYDITDKKALGQTRTCTSINWLAFSAGSRLISKAAEWINDQPKQLDPHLHVDQINQTIAQDSHIPPIIAYQPIPDGPIVLWEGHARAVAYYLCDKTSYPLGIYLGRAAASSTDLYAYDNGLNETEIRQLFMEERQQ